MLIGVTGQIGAGKSAVATLLARRGALIVDADKIGKQVSGSSAVLARLVRIWDDSILTKSGKLRPTRLAEIVFGDRSGRELERFNAIIRAPLGKAVLQKLRQAERTISRKSQPAPVVLDAALLPDWKIADNMNLIILVTAPGELRLKRLMGRGMQRDDATARMGRQSPLKRYREISDVVISNTATLDSLEEKVDRLWKRRIVPVLR
jgi:dephospho-CoA kinase